MCGGSANHPVNTTTPEAHQKHTRSTPEGAHAMKTLLRLEELFLTALAFYLFLALDYAWWWFLVLFLAPDISMIGYLLGPQVGAWSYNVAHHKGVAIALFLLGSYGQLQWLQLIGVIMLGHSSFDRILGYGLKYPDSFQHTHLGWIGRASAE
jgi:hypothetical protein